MNGLPETIADLIEVRRDRANEIERAADGMPNQFQCELIADLRDEADRLEAAWKREKTTIENSSAVGNAQKMREALEAVRDAHFVREENGEECEGFYAEADDGTGRPLICVVEDALAAPPRNCDTMNWRNAWDAWRSKRQIGKPQSAKEVYDLMAQFLDWYTSANYEEGK